jgi:hypothetical protein
VQFNFEDFSGCVDQPFTLQLDDASYPLTLISADKLPNSAALGDREAFSIVFRGEGDTTVLEQQTYRISNDTLGEMDLFIVPIGPDEKGMCYEAVFS